MTIWFTSDTHFSHANIIEFCGRPFRDVEEMNRVMVERWNARVQPGDTVYHLGDFAFGPVDNIGIFLKQLKGDVHLVRGNHDRSRNVMLRYGFAGVHECVVTDALTDGVGLLLTHKPDFRLNKTVQLHIDDGWVDYHLHGHVHDTYARRGNQINVGVDVRGFAPTSLEELLAA